MGDSVLLGYEEEGDEVSSLPQDCRSISRNSGSISINSGSLSPTSGKLLVESGSLSRHSAKIYINSSTDTAKSAPDSRNSNHSSLSRNSSNIIITSDGTHTLPNYRSQSSLSRNSSNIIINSDSRNASSLSRHSSNIIINSDVTNSVADSNSVSRNSSNIIVNSTNLSRNSSNSTDLVSTSVDSRSLSPGSNKLSPDSSEVSPGNEDSSVDAVDGEAHQADSPRKSFLAPLPGDLSSLPRDLLPKRNPFVRGSDPRVATCRGKLQNKRCQLNQEINKELRLRAGAENLFKATHNRKLRETVALELSFVNSNLQLLKEQLASLNSSVELYQNDSKDSVMPMVPLGLKETKEVDFREPFTDFILEHYSEDAACYQDAISDFMDMRQAIRTPVRHASGVALLFRYYNQLYFIERRFFPPDRSLGIYFEWFDSLTGVPSCQRTVAFEKACILFNMAAIYTQIGAKQDRSESKGLDSAVDSLLRAAGMFRYIHENFTNAPSMDLGPDMLDMLVNLMLAQARECLFEKLVLGAQEECVARDKELCDDLPLCLDLCQESQTLAQQYQQLGQKMQAETVISYVPNSWVSLVNIKTEFYKALAHHHIATGLLNATSSRSPGSTRAQERISSLHGSETNLPDYSDYSTSSDRNVDGAPAKNGGAGVTLASREEQRLAMGKAHLAEALASYEEALRLQRMCRELKSKQSLCRVLRQHHEKAINQSALMPDIPDFSDVLETPEIIKSTKFQLSLTLPDFAQHRVEDLFKSLGPVAIFSAKRHWSAPRLVQLQKSQISTRTLRADRQQRELKRLERNRANGKPNLPQDTEGVYRNGQKVLRSNSQYEKRDRSEDNSSYYYQREIIKSDEKYKLQHEESTRFDYTTNGTRRRNSKNNKLPVTRQNGVYINGYNNSDKKIIKAYDPDTFVIKYNEKNSSTSDLRYNKDGSNRIRIKNDLLIGNGNHLNGKNAYFQKSMGAENFGYLVKQNGGQLVEMGNREATLLRRISSECNLTSADGDACDEDGHTRNSDGFGFSVRGDAPVIIASVEPRSLADLGGMREGDFIVAIGERDVKWCQHDEVVRLIKAAKDSLSLKLVTPMDRNYLTATPLEYGDGKMNLLNGSPNPPHPGSNQGSVSAASTASSTGSGGAGGRAHAGAKRAPSWNPFRRHHASRDSSSHRGSHSSNVIFR